MSQLAIWDRRCGDSVLAFGMRHRCGLLMTGLLKMVIRENVLLSEVLWR